MSAAVGVPGATSPASVNGVTPPVGAGSSPAGAVSGGAVDGAGGMMPGGAATGAPGAGTGGTDSVEVPAGVGGMVPDVGTGGSAGTSSAGGGDIGTGGAGAEAAPPATLTVTSPSIDNVAECSETNSAVCADFPEENISYMESPNVSPELDWSGVPEGTKSFAVAFTDISFGQTHWVIWNIPGDATMLPAGIAQDTATPAVPAGATQSSATFSEVLGYLGPQAPCNVYQFEVFALSLETFTPGDPEYVTLVRSELDALGDAVLGYGTLTARSNYMMECGE